VKKIAILGGGVGAMTAAWALTSRPGWQSEFEITVYQTGWRLGGKGASGRNRERGERIEEHGLHVWMGFYDNAFRTMRECYRELGRPAGAPLATVDEAFRPHSLSVLCEFVGGRWVEWPIPMPVNSGVPGEGGALPTVWEYVQMIIQWLLEGLIGPRHEEAVEKILARFLGAAVPVPSAGPAVDFVRDHADSKASPPGDEHRGRLLAWLVEHLHFAHRQASAAPEPPAAESGDRGGLIAALEAFLGRLAGGVEGLLEKNDALRRLFLLADLAIAAVKGILRDGVLEKGFGAIDDLDFRAWLAKNGASADTLASAPIREIYDLCFAYENGDLARPNMAAGTAVQVALRIAFTYKGAVMYKMAAGMGDTVFGPLYEVLKRRGVKFAFFHTVEKLVPSPDGRSIAAIRVARQVDLAPGISEYQPFRDVKGLPCWPSEPHYDQLAQGEELQRRRIDLESRWSGWTPVQVRDLRTGDDFDLVVLGISLGALPEICADLVAGNAGWRGLVENVGSVQTQAVQLWLRPDAAALGCAAGGIVAGTYAEPLDTWADMSELLPREDWPAEGPKTILYLCGPKPGGDGPPPSATSYPAEEKERVIQTAKTWLESAAGPILPKATTVANPAGLDWSVLYPASALTAERASESPADGSLAPAGGDDAVGHAALAEQYTRANIDPSERYVLSLAGSAKHRLRAGGSGFDNLYLAGDWVETPLNAGCVEAAAMAGLAAAHAIGGGPPEIIGWDPDETAPVRPTKETENS